MEYTGNFEVHITVAADSDLTSFELWCCQQGFKFVHIILAQGHEANQPMVTWRHSHSQLSQMIEAAQLRCQQLSERGIEVTRLKIEADPQNEQVPLTDDQALAHSPHNYFEHHIKIRRNSTSSLDTLSTWCQQNRAHLSRNARRRIEEDYEERFVTLRDYRVGWSTTAANLQQLVDGLIDLGQHIVEVESEYSVYDSNLQLDAGWLPSPTVSQA